MKPHDRRAVLALAAGALGGLLIACGVGWLLLRPGPGGGWGGGGGGPGGGFAAEERELLAHLSAPEHGIRNVTVLRLGPHLRLTPDVVRRMGNPERVRTGDVIVRVVARGVVGAEGVREVDMLVFMRGGKVRTEPLLGGIPVVGGPPLPDVPMLITNRWGDDWPAHIEAEVRRLTGG